LILASFLTINLPDIGEVLAWLSVWNEVQMICTWSSWSCSSKIQNGLPFWYWLTRLSWKKGH